MSCNICDAPSPDGNAEGTLCRNCVREMQSAADDDARERATERRVEEGLDDEEERRHGR